MDEISIDQANAIIANKDPRSEAFWRNDTETVTAVQRAFEVAHPGEAEMGNISPELEKVMGEALDEKAAVSPGEPTSQEEYRAQVFDPLKVEWGGEYDQRIQTAQANLVGAPADWLNNLESRASPDQIRAALKLLSEIK